MLSPATQKKIVVTKNKQDALAKLTQSIGHDNIPSQLGGTLQWPAVNTLGTVPKGALRSEFHKPAFLSPESRTGTLQSLKTSFNSTTSKLSESARRISSQQLRRGTRAVPASQVETHGEPEAADAPRDGVASLRKEMVSAQVSQGRFDWVFDRSESQVMQPSQVQPENQSTTRRKSIVEKLAAKFK
jgi:hypothetical protein